MQKLRIHTIISLSVAVLISSGCSKSSQSSDSSMAMQAASSFASNTSTRETVSTSNNLDEFVLTSEMESRSGIQTEKAERRPLNKNIVFSSSIEATSKGSAVLNSIVHGVITRVLA